MFPANHYDITYAPLSECNPSPWYIAEYGMCVRLHPDGTFTQYQTGEPVQLRPETRFTKSLDYRTAGPQAVVFCFAEDPKDVKNQQDIVAVHADIDPFNFLSPQESCRLVKSLYHPATLERGGIYKTLAWSLTKQKVIEVIYKPGVQHVFQLRWSKSHELQPPSSECRAYSYPLDKKIEIYYAPKEECNESQFYAYDRFRLYENINGQLQRDACFRSFGAWQHHCDAKLFIAYVRPLSGWMYTTCEYVEQDGTSRTIRYIRFSVEKTTNGEFAKRITAWDLDEQRVVVLNLQQITQAQLEIAHATEFPPPPKGKYRFMRQMGDFKTCQQLGIDAGIFNI